MYKRCCLPGAAFGSDEPPGSKHDAIRAMLVATRKRDAERIMKYGHVRPPVMVQHAGQTFVAIGSRLLYHARWKTFHDFLFAYVGSLIEKDWFTTELSKPLEQRHPLMQWYHLLQEFGAAQKHRPGEVRKVESAPAQVSGLLSFAYDLYTLEHHGLLSERLVTRLKQPGLFQGARYETFVAAACIRVGFNVELEDESDPSTTHCEFTVTHRPRKPGEIPRNHRRFANAKARYTDEE